MNWYICIITSTDYYTLYDGLEIVQAASPEDAAELAKGQFKAKTKMDGFGSYRQIEDVIFCGKKQPKGV